MPEAQTWVLIIHLKTPAEIRKPAVGPFPAAGPFFKKKSYADPTEIISTECIILDRPMLILPSGQADKIEVFPITDATILHGKNFKRVLR